ncbi:unnamed protein product [Lactuca saligna]|uniref:Uncharacterized protein n=1 Tax=Lactuca saligna TaxID=75948 RepID=A0AA35ZKI6_LACSI|nr:unnamed protein product [Lactuca saligna]
MKTVRRKARSGGAAFGPLLVSGHDEDRRKKKVAGGEVSFDRPKEEKGRRRRGLFRSIAKRDLLRGSTRPKGRKGEAAKLRSSHPATRCEVRASQAAIASKTRPSEVCGQWEHKRKKARGKWSLVFGRLRRGNEGRTEKKSLMGQGKDRGKRERLLLSLIKGAPFVLLLLRKEERRRRRWRFLCL